MKAAEKEQTYTAKQSITIAAPRSKVWDAITKPELVKQYFFGTTVESTYKKGSPSVSQASGKENNMKTKGRSSRSRKGNF